MNTHRLFQILPTALLVLGALSGPIAQARTAPPGGPAQASPTAPPTVGPAETATTAPATAVPTGSPSPVGSATAARTATAESGAVPDERPFLVLMGSSANPSQPAAGSTFQLDLYLSNEGDADARDVQVGLSSDTFVAVDGGSTLFEDKIRDGEDETMSARLTVSAAATPGVHAIAVTLRYEDGEGHRYTDEATVGVEVSASVLQPVVVVQAVRMPGRVPPGLPFNLALDLVNTGGQAASNVTVAPAAGPLTLQGGGGSNPVTIPTGGLTTVTLRVVATDPESPGAAAQTLDLRYHGPTGEAFTASHVVGLVITGGAATDPLPMVTAYSAGDGPSLHPGEVFELVMEITNVGVADALRTFLSLGGGTAPATSGSSGTSTGGSGGSALGVFAPLDTSNLRYLGRLAAGASTTVTQRLVVDGAAKPGPYVLDLDLSYVDAEGQAQAHTEVISLVVTRPVDLGITATNPVTSTVAGEPLPFPVEVLNRGSNTVTVTELALTGPDDVAIADGSRYVGELDSGASDTLEPVVTAHAAGTVVLSATARYLDDLKNEQQVTTTFTLTVAAEAPEVEAPDEPTGGSDNLLVRVLKGFLGLGASPPVDTAGIAVPGPAGKSGAPARRGSGNVAPAVTNP